MATWKIDKMTNKKQKTQFERLNQITFGFDFFEKNIRRILLEYSCIQLTTFIGKTKKKFQFLEGMKAQPA